MSLSIEDIYNQYRPSIEPAQLRWVILPDHRVISVYACKVHSYPMWPDAFEWLVLPDQSLPMPQRIMASVRTYATQADALEEVAVLLHEDISNMQEKLARLGERLTMAKEADQ